MSTSMPASLLQAISLGPLSHVGVDRHALQGFHMYMTWLTIEERSSEETFKESTSLHKLTCMSFLPSSIPPVHVPTPLFLASSHCLLLLLQLLLVCLLCILHAFEIFDCVLDSHHNQVAHGEMSLNAFCAGAELSLIFACEVCHHLLHIPVSRECVHRRLRIHHGVWLRLLPSGTLFTTHYKHGQIQAVT